MTDLDPRRDFLGWDDRFPDWVYFLMWIGLCGGLTGLIILIAWLAS